MLLSKVIPDFREQSQQSHNRAKIEASGVLYSPLLALYGLALRTEPTDASVTFWARRMFGRMRQNRARGIGAANGAASVWAKEKIFCWRILADFGELFWPDLDPTGWARHTAKYI